MSKDQKHSIYDDLFAILTCAVLMSLGVNLLLGAGVLTGGINGYAILGTMFFDYTYGQIFFVLNLPFYVLTHMRMGWAFTLKTIVAVTVVSLGVDYLHLMVHLQVNNIYIATLSGGIMCGSGLLIIMRHNASLGGLTALAQLLQAKYNMSAGRFLMLNDSIIVVISMVYLPWENALLSLMAMVCVNFVLIANHKPGRYTAK